ncbi:MAG TPA: aminopeptidase, partial [Limnochordia bacterium]|nr:aminopeptidase [Limnochordia bacterium]
MESEFDQLIDRYAELAVRVGVNIQPGQWLRLAAPIQAADLARRIVRKAYEAGAKDVEVAWGDGLSQRIRLSHAPQASLDEFPGWKLQEAEAILAAGAAFLTVQAPDPDLLADVDPQRFGAAQRAAQVATAEFSGKLLNTASWSGISAATPEWAARILPNLAGEEGVRELWRRIFAATRVDQPDPVAAWTRHMADLAARSQRLADLQLRALHYRAPGTDLHVRL